MLRASSLGSSPHGHGYRAERDGQGVGPQLPRCRGVASPLAPPCRGPAPGRRSSTEEFDAGEPSRRSRAPPIARHRAKARLNGLPRPGGVLELRELLGIPGSVARDWPDFRHPRRSPPAPPPPPDEGNRPSVMGATRAPP